MMNVNVNADDFVSEAEAPRAVVAPRIQTPTIVILLGSTSSIAALELMRQMLTLRAEDRRRVAFVYIDTDDWSSSLIEFRHQYNGLFNEFPLRIAVPAGIDHITRVDQEVSDPLSMKGTPDERRKELHTFIERHTPQYFANGAGGIRNNGHVAACFRQQDIYTTLEQALSTVARLDERQGSRRVHEVQVNIVAFLGGGTGSGIMPDITVMVRDLLINRQLKQRINLFCMLPEPIRGVSITDLSWRKSNATACLLEILAYSLAARQENNFVYSKRMRDKVYRLTRGAIANEIYLIGHAAMDDATNTARIVGLDLFQRITDASGVGFLEHSKWVDRRTLGETDDRGLPTMFGTSCPLEVRFPADETARAFARISAAYLLPLLASYEPVTTNPGPANVREWRREWDDVARISPDPGDPRAIHPSILKLDEFAGADQRRLDITWNKLERFERDTERRIREEVALKKKEELENIQTTPSATTQDENTSLINLRTDHLKRLQQEYAQALEQLTARERPGIPGRPIDLEGNLTTPGNWWFRVRNMRRDFAYEVFETYNNHLQSHAESTRYRLVEELLRDLLEKTQETLDSVVKWFEATKFEEHTQQLEVMGKTSMAWRGYLDQPHPHQRHLFDLRTLRGNDGRNVAVERLYVWSTGGERALNEGTPIDYSLYVKDCVDFIANQAQSSQDDAQESRLEDFSAGRLADRVVDYFHDYYMRLFQDMNLFELLDKAAPASPKGQPRSRQLSSYFLEHLQHIRNLMASLVAFEAELWSKGTTTLDTSIYMGMHFRDGYQRGVLDQALDTLGPVTTRGQSAIIEPSIDPHRLQAVYAQHAISLSTVRDFYLQQNSSMEAYEEHQRKWDGGGSKGLMPVHSSSEAQWLVRDVKLADDPTSLSIVGKPITVVEGLIRTPFDV
ncbi:MAG: tubulin-like doman-containing protein [Ktedonobacteraceae bacterium]